MATRLLRLPAPWVALLLSVALHGLVVLLLSAGSAKHDSPFTLDTRVPDGPAEMEIRVVEEEPPAPLPIARAILVPAAPASTPTGPVKPAPPLSTPNLVTGAEAHPSALPGMGQPAVARALAAAPGSQARGAGGAGTDFFHIGTSCKTVVYVIDRSASMGLNGGLAVAKRELLASLNRLPPETRFQVIFYNRSAEPLRIGGRSDLLPATPDYKRQVALLLETLDAEGGTEHLSALQHALAFQPEVIFFLTDADDLRDDQIRAVTLANHGQTAIHAIQLTASQHNDGNVPLFALARANQGQYQAVCVGEQQ